MPTLSSKPCTLECAACGRHSHPVASQLLFASQASMCMGLGDKPRSHICRLCTGRSTMQASQALSGSSTYRAVLAPVDHDHVPPPRGGAQLHQAPLRSTPLTHSTHCVVISTCNCTTHRALCSAASALDALRKAAWHAGRLRQQSGAIQAQSLCSQPPRWTVRVQQSPAQCAA